ncbi:MAG: hypothetical protein MZV70_33110 [Desulfobacterales bacterium]|nr:hypothetical protein [Desulfobacterales bacterium]
METPGEICVPSECLGGRLVYRPYCSVTITATGEGMLLDGVSGGCRAMENRPGPEILTSEGCFIRSLLAGASALCNRLPLAALDLSPVLARAPLSTGRVPGRPLSLSGGGQAIVSEALFTLSCPGLRAGLLVGGRWRHQHRLAASLRQRAAASVGGQKVHFGGPHRQNGSGRGCEGQAERSDTDPSRRVNGNRRGTLLRTFLEHHLRGGQEFVLGTRGRLRGKGKSRRSSTLRETVPSP